MNLVKVNKKFQIKFRVDRLLSISQMCYKKYAFFVLVNECFLDGNKFKQIFLFVN
ncbi:MAG: hypothetical protein JETT_2058 [Candidatus Jettenia ecosi]|uniref:Uncharacterized protein n=1 Tax=Candidatus Jettenia ecosi TaxID=2494326 RepID=A0A533QAG9_9BACT|nr:MAG: hypothetical protein JETT_2058 [Candidatus Jettenia ecosi]